MKTAARLSDWIHRIGVAGLGAVNEYLVENFDDDDQRQKYAEWALQDFNFLWCDNHITWDAENGRYKVSIMILSSVIILTDIKVEEGKKLKGLWLHETFLRTLGEHFTQMHGARKVDAFGDPKTIRPVGVMGLCAVSVGWIFLVLHCQLIPLQLERAYRLWQTRTITEDTYLSTIPQEWASIINLPKVKGIAGKKIRSTHFCHATCGQHQTQYTVSAAKIKHATWEKIIVAAKKYSKAKKPPPARSAEIFANEVGESSFNLRANLVEDDSGTEW